MIAYPDTGGKDSITYGITSIDFWNGVSYNPAGTKTILGRNLKDSKQEYIRSLAIFCSETATIRLGIGRSVKTIISKYGWNLFENINIREVEIETFTAGTPDVNEILVIGSTSSKSIYQPKDIVMHVQNAKTLASVNADVAIFEKITDNFNHVTFILKEDGTNSITYTIQGKMTGPSAYADIQAATVLSASTDIIQIAGSWSMIRVLIKSTVGAAHGNVLGQYSALG